MNVTESLKMKIDPLIAGIIDEIAQQPMIRLQFDESVDDDTKNKMNKIFEIIRPDIEYEIIKSEYGIGI